jgi:ketosteroid isomerase-like protein
MEILAQGDYESLRELMHPDVVHEMPQSGERVRGIDNVIATFTNRPGRLGPDLASARVVEKEPRYVMTPTFNIVRVEGAEEIFTVYSRTRYPDGSDWYFVALVTVHDGKIAKDVAFFAPCYPAPEWRAPWVEPLDG